MFETPPQQSMSVELAELEAELADTENRWIELSESIE